MDPSVVEGDHLVWVWKKISVPSVCADYGGPHQSIFAMPSSLACYHGTVHLGDHGMSVSYIALNLGNNGAASRVDADISNHSVSISC